VKKHDRYISTIFAILIIAGLSLSSVHFHGDSHSHQQAEYSSVEKDLPCAACVIVKYTATEVASTPAQFFSDTFVVQVIRSVKKPSLQNLIPERAPPA